jgi:hypothetical protein
MWLGPIRLEIERSVWRRRTRGVCGDSIWRFFRLSSNRRKSELSRPCLGASYERKDSLVIIKGNCSVSGTCASGEHPGGVIRRGSSLETQIRVLTQIIDGLLQYAREIVPISGSVELRASRSAAAEIRSRWRRRRECGILIPRGLENPPGHQDVKEFVR